MTCAVQDFTILKGKTFSRVLRWESKPFVYKNITGISKAAPAVVTATAHGLPDGWRCAIVSATGMTEINAENFPPKSSEFYKGTVLTANTVELNDVNSSEYTTYVSGGALMYYTPVDMAGFTARMQVRASEGSLGTPLLSLTTENAGIAIDNVAKTITLLISATDTAAITFLTGVYDLELVSSGGVVTQILKGDIIVQEEVTR